MATRHELVRPGSLFCLVVLLGCEPANKQYRLSDDPLVGYVGDSTSSRQLLALCDIGTRSAFVGKVQVLSLGDRFFYAPAWPALPMTPVRMSTLVVLKGAAAFATSGNEITFHGEPDGGVLEAGPLFRSDGAGVTAWVAAGFWAPSKLHASVGNWFVMGAGGDAGTSLVAPARDAGSDEWPGLRAMVRMSEADFAREIMTPCPAPPPPLPRDPNDAGIPGAP